MLIKRQALISTVVTCPSTFDIRKDIFIKNILGWLLQMEEAWKQLGYTDYQG